MPTTLMRTCDLCPNVDGLPRNDLTLAQEPLPVGLLLHLHCAAEVMDCAVCGPQVKTMAGLSGEPLRDQILAHHKTGS